MRIRTDGDYAYREDVIEQAAEFYNRNKTASVTRACEDVPSLIDGITAVLERDDLTHSQRKELAKALSTRYIGYEIIIEDQEIAVEPVING
jgi:hypothetical protein